jgi:hypothetical protein
LKHLWLNYADIGLIFDNQFFYEDSCLPNLLWRELEDERVTITVITLPTENLPDSMLFSGRTIVHQKLCAQVAAWLLLAGRGYSAANRDLGYAGGISDVASADGRLFAECGYTHVGKILRGLHDGCEIVVASYSFEPVIFRRAGVMHFEAYLKKQEEKARETVNLLPTVLRYEDRHKAEK